MIYLDNQATTPCDPAVVAAMAPWWSDWFGNPHSAEHAAGQRAADAVEAARREVATLIGADPREIVLTSGATEANNLAIKGAARLAGAGASGGGSLRWQPSINACWRACGIWLPKGSSRWFCRWSRAGCWIWTGCGRRCACRRCW